ncbi:hypothetical protein FNV43_RR04147 [Rhamnella rubrinervis]|uniref:Uncharacterized protein n=1 Tax=Rhamnella rubrinervis TaxID=2594499 RepID=A0A8K0HJ11_9ROSA|nr:hypothetical protein FNV43_RR04147 [Rhamnella rubrinervis]
MSSMLSSQGVVLATAMAVSGTVILLALRLQKSLPNTQFSVDQINQCSSQILRSCISSEDNKRKKKKSKKRVHFAEDVVDPSGDGEVFRRQHGVTRNSSNSSSSSSTSSSPSSSSASSSVKFKKTTAHKYKGMPPNRAALYHGILRDRVVHRLAYSY